MSFDPTLNTRTQTHAHKHTHAQTHTHTNTHICTNTHTHTHTNKQTYVQYLHHNAHHCPGEVWVARNSFIQFQCCLLLLLVVLSPHIGHEEMREQLVILWLLLHRSLINLWNLLNYKFLHKKTCVNIVTLCE